VGNNCPDRKSVRERVKIMRKIEKQMNDAIKKGKNWSCGNTQVIHESSACYVYLHGNRLATITSYDNIIVDIDTLRHWPTPTTKSRLKALGVDVYTKNHVTYLNGEVI